MLPERLQENIDQLAKEEGLKNLSSAAEELSARYRSGSSKLMETKAHRLAYLLTRMPATFAAVSKVMRELTLRIPTLSLNSLLDLGAGPGTGMWAVKELFPHISTLTLFEKDAALLALGKRLSEGRGTWIQADLEKKEDLPKHDLVLLSYSLGELSNQEKVVRLAWKAANKILIVVEPGTVLGYERLKLIRTQLIQEGGALIAPCPHADKCPLKPGDWCHFSERLPRTSLHRQMKGGTLGYEDEKFFYLIFSKISSLETFAQRIVRHPQKQSGFVQLTVCSKDGVCQKIISRKDKDLYRFARKADWGDSY